MTTIELGKILVEAMIEGKTFSLSEEGKKRFLKYPSKHDPKYYIKSIDSQLEVELGFSEEKSGLQFSDIYNIPVEFINLDELL